MTEPVSPDAYFEKLSTLLRLEEEEEALQFDREFISKTPEEREKIGRALLKVVVSSIQYSPGGHHLVIFEYPDKRPIPLFSFEPGDVVWIHQNKAADLGGRHGTVYERFEHQLTIAFDESWPETSREYFYDINESSRKGSYKKMHEALKEVAHARHSRASVLRDITFGLKKPEFGDPVNVKTMSFFNKGLNEFQKQAVQKVLESKDISLVHGPPGTGKTTVLVEIIEQVVRTGAFVFACAPSNTACDHLLECLIRRGIPALRLGHPARIMEHLREHTLDFKLMSHEDARFIENTERELEELEKKEKRKIERKSLTWPERQEIIELKKALKNEINLVEKELFRKVLAEAPVMVGTLASSRENFLRKKLFDWLIVDEATQATEPAVWIPILKTDRLVLAGDHFQLSPTVRSKEAEKKGLSVSLFERCYPVLPEECKTLLRLQYRMHESIMNFSSEEFYEGKLVADESVKQHVLADLPSVQNNDTTREAFVFWDTAGRGFEEKLEPSTESRMNPDEAELVLELLKQLLDSGLQPSQIAVISPYSAQVRLLRSKIPDPRLEVDSVDGFQGREKEAVILSLVRSNMQGEMGFLTDTRRMNVAMTRARRKLMVVGDSATLSSIPFYRDFIQYAERINAYRSSWELA